MSCATILALLLTALPQPLAAAREGECEDNPFRDVNPGPGSLKTLRPVEPTDLTAFVTNRQAAIVLGKALFWDMQAGSDGVQSCGTCHFRAGADPRTKAQLAPGGLNNSRTVLDLGANAQLTTAHFPLHKVIDPANRASTVLQSIDDVVSSQGVKSFTFQSAARGASSDKGVLTTDRVFNVAGVNVRRSEPRNTPTVINAAFSRRLFWDGRADHVFNGVSPFGVRDANARVIKASGNTLTTVKVRIDNAALASQAVGPLTSDLEMGYINRPLRDVGRRLVSAQPLANQVVDKDDSVLGTVSLSNLQGGKRQGLVGRYLNYIQAAFAPQWWNSTQMVVVGANNSVSFKTAPPTGPVAENEYTLAEYNFSLFFGLAVQLYEMTLISDDAPIDRYFDGNANAISASAKRGLELFKDNACAACHAGAEFTNASVRILNGANGEPGEIVERMPTGNCNVGLYDQSFYNIGVRPWAEDLGIGGMDPFGNPLAIAKLLTMPRGQIPSQELFDIAYPNVVPGGPRIGERTVEKGAFKVPSLRNISATAPYFHNGGQATLKQVVQFYNRGGDFRDANVEFVDFEIGKLNLTEAQLDDLVEFLKTLTDDRVLKAEAPFDHPQLFVPNGAKGDSRSVQVDTDGSAKDDLLEIEAVGRKGGKALPGFLE